ncbi:MULTISPECIES: hypothetical protein [unclassified Marinovum]|uniref:hypothetical protein n=1 Tax=unclassified Marinovum TaxID=2647166 RepID=UPI003EDB9E5E
MFKVVKNPTFTATVKISAPTEGGFSDGSFTGRFRALSVSDAEDFNLLTAEGTADYLRTILIGWDGVVGDDGEPVSFNDASRDQLLDIPFVRVAILNTYNSAMMGAKRGN